MVALWPNPFTFVLAVAIIGSRQLGLTILMHDGAHGCLANDERSNMALSQWLCAYPVFAETKAYRRYHLRHHARTQQADDPDLILSAPFPITRPSYRRKFWRDISGQTGYAQRKAQFLNALGDRSWPLARRAAHFWERLGPQLVFNLVFLAGLAAAGVWWAYPLLWALPLVTWMMVITRIRNIAEHAVCLIATISSAYAPRARYIERLFIAPYLSTTISSTICCSTFLATTCRACTRFSLVALMPHGWRCRRIMQQGCGLRPRSPQTRTGLARW